MEVISRIVVNTCLCEIICKFPEEYFACPEVAFKSRAGLLTS